MDDYETHDDRRLIPGTGFTIEPGVYTNSFGVRTEINMFVGERDASVTGPRQQEIVRSRSRGRSGALQTCQQSEWRTTMSTRKTTLFYAVLIAVASARRRHGHRVAAGPAAGLVGADASACRR